MTVSLPGVAIYHPRSEWQDSEYPITGPAADQSAITTAVVHYTAAEDLPDGDTGETVEDVAALLRRIQRSYSTGRGYSIGYRWAVDWLGGVWQLRGWEFKSAANKGNPDITGVANFNVYSEPILCLVDGNDMASPMMVRSVQAIIAESQRRSGRTFRVVGHGDIDATGCPGAGLRAQVKAGVFVPSPDVPTPPPPPPTIPGDPTMWPDAYCIVTFTKAPFGAFLVGPGGVVHLDAGLRDAYAAAGVKSYKSTNDDVHASYTRVARGLSVGTSTPEDSVNVNVGL